MIPIHELLFFVLAALILVISPAPNMIYLISRTITQGRKAGLTSLAGVICGFLFHIVMVSFGLTAVLFAVPYAYIVLKTLETLYLLYLAYQAVKPNSKNIFEVDRNITTDRPGKLFTVGFLTNLLNPKVAGLIGLDNTNSTAYSRAIVLHKYSAVPDKETTKPIVLSLGCHMVSPAFFSVLVKYIDNSQKDIVLYMYTSYE